MGKSLAQPSLLSSPKLYTGHSAHSATKPPSPSGPSAGACSGAGSWFMPASPSPVCFLWAAALQLQPLGRSSLPSLPPFLRFHQTTGGCEGTFQKDLRGASPIGRRASGNNRPRQAFASREFHSLSVANQGAGQSVKTASALTFPLEAEGVLRRARAFQRHGSRR